MIPEHDVLLGHRAVAARSSEELIGLVRSGNPNGSERIEAAELLGYRRCSEAIPALLGMLAEGYPHSVAAAEALAKIGDPVVIPHLERACEAWQAVCAGAHLHWDDNCLFGVLATLLRFRGHDELHSLARREGLDGYLAGRELERRRATRLLRELLSRGQAVGAAAVRLHRSGKVEGWAVPLAVEAVTGLPFEESRYLVVCALQAKPGAAADGGGTTACEGS